MIPKSQLNPSLSPSHPGCAFSMPYSLRRPPERFLLEIADARVQMSTGERAPLAPFRYTVIDKGGGRDDAARPYTMSSVPRYRAMDARAGTFFAPVTVAWMRLDTSG